MQVTCANTQITRNTKNISHQMGTWCRYPAMIVLFAPSNALRDTLQRKQGMRLGSNGPLDTATR